MPRPRSAVALPSIAFYNGSAIEVYLVAIAAVFVFAASPAVSMADQGTGIATGDVHLAPGPPPASLVRALGRIPPASMLRVQPNNLGLLEGTLEHWDVHSLRLGEPTGEREIPLSSVQALWVRGRATGHGAKVGAIIAGIVGAVAGAATVALGRGLAEGGGPDGLRGNYLGMAAVGAVAGGGIGALAGAGVGMSSARWNRRFHR